MDRRRGIVGFAVVVLAVLTAASARGQSSKYPYHRIEVLLNGSTCTNVPEDIFVVVYSEKVSELTLAKAGKNVWAADLDVWLPDSFGSVHWPDEKRGSKLTECLPGDGRERTNLLRFAFPRCYQAQQITFETAPDTLASRYVREQGVCKQNVDFTGSETADFVGLKIEQLRLQFGPPDRRRGLLVNAVVRSKKRDKFVVTRDWVAHALSAQRDEGDGAGSNLAPNAIDLDLQNLNAIRFKSVTVEMH
jgi:hypothetical protein